MMLRQSRDRAKVAPCGWAAIHRPLYLS